MPRPRNCDGELRLKPEIKDVSYMGEIDQIGIVNNGTTREEVVQYYFTTTSPHILPAMRFIKDAARYPVFDEEEFAREKEVVLGELERNMSQPGYTSIRNRSTSFSINTRPAKAPAAPARPSPPRQPKRCGSSSPGIMCRTILRSSSPAM